MKRFSAKGLARMKDLNTVQGAMSMFVMAITAASTAWVVQIVRDANWTCVAGARMMMVVLR